MLLLFWEVRPTVRKQRENGEGRSFHKNSELSSLSSAFCSIFLINPNQPLPNSYYFSGHFHLPSLFLPLIYLLLLQQLPESLQFLDNFFPSLRPVFKGNFNRIITLYLFKFDYLIVNLPCVRAVLLFAQFLFLWIWILVWEILATFCYDCCIKKVLLLLVVLLGILGLFWNALALALAFDTELNGKFWSNWGEGGNEMFWGFPFIFLVM